MDLLYFSLQGIFVEDVECVCILQKWNFNNEVTVLHRVGFIISF